MPAVQTSFARNQDKYLKGQPVESRYNSNSRIVEDAAGITFALPVQRGASGGLKLAVEAEVDTFLGITMREKGRPPSNQDTVPKGSPISYMEDEGSIAVDTDAAVADGGEAYFNTSTKKWTVAAGANIIGPFPGVLFDGASSAAGLTPLRFTRQVIPPAA